MVNRKALIIASTTVGLLIAAGVVLAVMFTVVYPNGAAKPTMGELAAPNPGMKLTDSYGNWTGNDTWVMTYLPGTDVNAVKDEMEAAGMPWDIKGVDQSQNFVIMSCDRKMVPMAKEMNLNSKRGRYVEKLVKWSYKEATSVWGIDRIDGALDGNFNTGGKFDGTGVDVHILDTGVNAAHTAFGGRVKAGYDAFPNDNSLPTQDCQGHGTHVAGTVAGNTYGIARGSDIYGSQVLGCDGSGSTTGIVAAINYVANIQTNRKKVINMSLGGGASTLLDQAVANAVTKGVVVVVAAGNENQDACNVSPAREPSAITVAASDKADTKASFSNWGKCVDIVGPGVNIVSASNVANDGTKTMSGTSMASPHVAGVAALYAQAYPSYTPTQIRDQMVNDAQKNRMEGFADGATPNAFLYWNPATGGTPTTQETTSTTTQETTTTSQETTTPSETTDPKDDTIIRLTIGDQGSATVPQGGDGYYTSNGPGTHVGTLTGAGGTDFDLYLWRWVGDKWAVAARSETPLSQEKVEYNSVDNGVQYYIWQVASFTGSGDAILEYSAPA